MKFSVVIPLYNKEKHIKETIDSVLGQTYQDFEIIVINDGSSDKGPEIVRKIKSDAIFLYNQKNQGVSVARNLGAEKSTGDFILFLDADDGLLPDYMSQMHNLIKEFPQAGMYATNKYEFKGQTGIYLKRKIDFTPYKSTIPNYFKTVISNRSLLGPVYVVKKSVFNKSGGFVPGMLRGQDTYLQSIILMEEQLCYLNEPLYYYRVDAANMATQYYRPPKTQKSLLDFLGKYDKYTDLYIISYSLSQVEKYIESGYKTFAANWLNQIIERSPDKYLNLIEKRQTTINKKFKTPFFYFKLRKLIISLIISAKDRVQIFFFKKRLFKDFNSGSLKL